MKKTLPTAFLEKLRRLIPPRHWERTLKSFSSPKPTTFRVNRLRADGLSVRRELEDEGFKVENIPWTKDAFILRKGLQKDLERTDCYREGRIYVQGLSSMIPPLALDPAPGEKVLDLTAAPGSKTTQMAALMEGKGRILANDESPVRLEKLKANAERQGAVNVEALPAGDGGSVWKDHQEAFDRVLLDAPCSSEGRFLLEKGSTYGYWREDTNRKMAKIQRRLFKSAFLALKPGGTMVYSTCTFAPEENEMILDWALGNFGEALEVEKIDIPLPQHLQGLDRWEGSAFHPSITRSLRILPTEDLEGFFVARIRKQGSITIGQDDRAT